MEHRTAEHRRGVTAGAIAYGLWGLFPLYFHHTSPASPFEVLFHRMVWTLLVVTAVLAARRDWQWWATLRRDPRLLARIGVAAAMVSANWAMYIWAVDHDRVVDAALGYFINPLVTVALGVVVLHERLRRLQRFAVGLGVVAVAVLTVAYGRPPWIALFLAGTFAAYGYLKKSIPVGAVQSLWTETVLMAPIAVVGLISLSRSGDATFTSEGPGHATLLVASGVVTAVPLVLFGVAARRIPLSLLGLLQYMTPVLQMICGVVAFGESVPAARWIGFAVVWTALAALVTDAVRELRRPLIAVHRSESLGPAPVGVID